MIESLMLIALGFFVATLFAAIAAQFVWRRAVTVTRRSLEEGGTEDDARVRELDDLMQRHRRETAPLEAEIQRLRTEKGSLAASKDAIAHENELLASENNDLRAEIDRLSAETAELRAHIDAGAADAAQRIAKVRRELSALEAAIASKPEPARAQVQAAAPVATAQEEVEEPADPQLADPGIDEAEAARTLAEVKASLARLDASAEEPRPAATADAHLAETQVGDKALLARIRALEAGVAN